jgi:hypothetical protein
MYRNKEVKIEKSLLVDLIVGDQMNVFNYIGTINSNFFPIFLQLQNPCFSKLLCGNSEVQALK